MRGSWEFHKKFVLIFGAAKTYEHNLLDERSVIDRHLCHMGAKFSVSVDENHDKHHTLYWLHKIH